MSRESATYSVLTRGPPPRTASGPRVMASLRNLVLAILRMTGAASVAAAGNSGSIPASRRLANA